MSHESVNGSNYSVTNKEQRIRHWVVLQKLKDD